jgi:hypothetical protein
MQHKVLPGLEGRDGGPIALAFAEQLLSGQDVRSLDTAFPINAASARVRHSRLMAADIDVATAILDRIAMNPSLADRVLELRRAGLKAAAGRKEEGRREHEARKAVAEKRKRNNDSATSKTNNSGRYDHRDGRVDGRQHGGGNARRMERETPYSRRPPCNTAQWSTSMRRPVGM